MVLFNSENFADYNTAISIPDSLKNQTEIYETWAMSRDTISYGEFWA